MRNILGILFIVVELQTVAESKQVVVDQICIVLMMKYHHTVYFKMKLS